MMTCEDCGGLIYAVIHENIGRAWLHEEPQRDEDHEAVPVSPVPPT